MKRSLTACLRCTSCGAGLKLETDCTAGEYVSSGSLLCHCGKRFPIIRGIPRFVDSDGYTGNFTFEWSNHRTTQVDSLNGRDESERRFAQSFDYPLADLRDRRILDAGCGAGRFAEVAIRHGAHVVAVDLSGSVDSAFQTLGEHPRLHLIQADIRHLPLAEASFDLVYSLGVLHHTPDPRAAFSALTRQLKPGGEISITLYAAYNKTYVAASEFWRSVARRLPQRLLYRLCWIARPLYYLYRLPVLRPIGLGLFPISLHPNPDWRHLDTFDWYSPRYQSYHTHHEVFQWFRDLGFDEVRVLGPGISLIGRRSERVLTGGAAANPRDEARRVAG